MIEICCGSYEDAYNAFLGGAKRIELNSALHLGGLTPSLGSLILTKKNTDLQVICMVRPRGAGFLYNEVEYAQMKEDAHLLLQNGADGLAFGFLHEDRTIDIERTKEFMDIITSYGKEAVFHRAYDCVKDPIKSMEVLLSLRVHRLLTSGLQAKAMDGKELIKSLQEKYGNDIEILVGSGMNATNAKTMLEYSGVSQVHSSCKDWCEDVTTIGENVHYSYGPTPHESDYDYVSVALVKGLLASL